MIDLRSDTVTKPTRGMLEFMMNAEVGDDVYGEDPSVNNLQDLICDITGKEKALFVSSGVMGNQLCIASQTYPGDEIIVESNAHIFYYENAAPSVISRVQCYLIDSENGEMPIDKILEAIRQDVYYLPVTRMICIENTHNRHSGTIISINYLEQLSELAKSRNVLMHLDGARLWNASVETGISIKDYCKYFDSVSLCLSKGLGAPVGSVIAGTKEMITRAHKWRKTIGGGMRQSGILASAGIYAIENHLQLLKSDHEHAKYFANKLTESKFISLDLNKVETNIVYFRLDNSIDTNTFIYHCSERNLLISALGNSTIRAVFHFQIDDIMTDKALDTIFESLNKSILK